jgi:N-acetylglucosamine-6-sulfatase
VHFLSLHVLQDRWRTLLSVDDVISQVVELVEELQPNKTYYIFTSDHGYSLGELNLNWDKRNVYDWDTRIHMLARGPGIMPGSSFAFGTTSADRYYPSYTSLIPPLH